MQVGNSDGTVNTLLQGLTFKIQKIYVLVSLSCLFYKTFSRRMKTMNEQQVPTVDQFVYIIIKCDVTN